MSENKTGSPAEASAKVGKYLKYAIGEIILVVIGILIAIQVNALYSNRALKSENRLILKRMLNELESNVARLYFVDTTGQSLSRAYNLPSYRESEINLDSCYKIIQNGIKPDDIDFLIKKEAYNFSSISAYSSVYEEMLNTGKIYALKSDTLTTKIDRYYKQLERESYYVNKQLEEAQRSYENCKHGWMYFKQIYKTDRDKAIEDNPWLFNKNASEYKNLSNYIFKAKTVTIRTRDRMKGLIAASNNLAKALNNYLND